MKIDTPKRSWAKAISWRIISIIITFFVTLLITRSAKFAVSVSLLDTAIKLITYYFHERTWTHVKWGRLKKRKKNKIGKKMKHDKIKHDKVK